MITPGCAFSPDRRYRYTLIRRWSSRDDFINFVMLNPSTADEIDNDPTVERCERRARQWGFAGLIVTNIFALRSTDPRALYDAADPVGPDNNRHILDMAQRAALIVCAWGGHGKYRGRSTDVRRLLSGLRLHYLKLNGDGEPAHPLYLPYALLPQEMR